MPNCHGRDSTSFTYQEIGKKNVLKGKNAANH